MCQSNSCQDKGKEKKENNGCLQRKVKRERMKLGYMKLETDGC